MSPETILALVQLLRFGIDTMERYTKGEMTDEEVAAEWASLQTRLGQANNMWERAARD